MEGDPFCPKRVPLHVKNVEPKLSDNIDIALTLDGFIKYVQGKSLEQLWEEREKYRYVIDPANPNRVIDMRHFIAFGLCGPFKEPAEWLWETLQSYSSNPGTRASAWYPQDLFSNSLGVMFFVLYNSNISDFTTHLKDFFDLWTQANKK